MTRWPAAVAILLLTACATTPPVDMDEPRRVVGTESAVRVDAEIRGEELRLGGSIPITYEITNQRETAIAIADVLPITSYDRETKMVTVDIGAEVPGEQTLPRLVTIGPGEKKSFTAQPRMNFVVQTKVADPRTPVFAASLRIRVNFLGDVAPFKELLDIPERVVADAKLADTLFPMWLERNEVIYTNALPMRWSNREAFTQPTDAPATPARRGRRP